MKIRTSIANALERIQHVVSYPQLLSAGMKGVNRTFARDLLFLRKKLGFEPQTILDVGAATGEWSKAAAWVYPRASVHAFEPVPVSFAKLSALSRDIPAIRTYNVVVGERNDRCCFHLNEFPDASSILRPTSRHTVLFPHSRETGAIEVVRRRLDSFAESLVPPVLLKLDVQGSEMEVLEGCGALLERVAVIQAELNFDHLYEGQTDYDLLITWLKQRGFGTFMQWHSHFGTDGGPRVVFCDAVFLRDGRT